MELNLLFGLTCLIAFSIGNILLISYLISVGRSVFTGKKYYLVFDLILLTLFVFLPSVISFFIGGSITLGNNNKIVTSIVMTIVFFSIGIQWTRTWWKSIEHLENKL